MSEQAPPPGPMFEVLSLFPEAVEAFVQVGMVGRAIESGRVGVHCTSYREFTSDPHRTVDDTPFGGGAGMVLKIEPVVAAIEAVEAARGPAHRVLLTPSAPRFSQADAERLAGLPRIMLLCGRYEGIDDRVREHFVDECFSLGDFVLMGGEVAAVAVIETVSRLCEGVLGNPSSPVAESFASDPGGGVLEYPQYTRPAEFRGLSVPDVLLSGNHEAIASWRRDQSATRTWSIRPDLRHTRELPRESTLYVAIDRELTAAELADLARVARHHEVAGLIGVGSDAEALAIAWARESGGRIPVAVFPDLRALARRLRRRHGDRPRLVALTTHEDAIHRGEELVDRLLVSGGASAPIVLLTSSNPPADAFARFAPDGAEPPTSEQGLALAPMMNDKSEPYAPALIDRALAALPRTRRSPGERP